MVELNAELEHFLKQYCSNEVDAKHLVESNLTKFLQATESLPLSNSERLRQLAIYFEKRLAMDWQTVQLIYKAAAEIESGDPNLFLSWGVAATLFAEIEDNPSLRI